MNKGHLNTKSEIQQLLLNEAYQCELLSGNKIYEFEFPTRTISEFLEKLLKDLLHEIQTNTAIEPDPLLRSAFYYMFNVSVEIIYFESKNKCIDFEYDFWDVLNCATICTTPRFIYECVMDQIEKIILIFNKVFACVFENGMFLTNDSLLAEIIQDFLISGAYLGYEFIQQDLKKIRNNIKYGEPF